MRVAGRQKGSKQIPYTHALVQPSAPKSRYTFAYYSSEKKAKAAQKKYQPLIGNPLRVIKQSGKSANTDIHESLWDNIRKRRASGKAKLKPGQKGYPKTLKIEDDKRIPRKKGQPAGSDKHSDLYTDENPKGTILGLKFATVDDAEASVNKIKNSGKKHAHKIQAAIAMEQRARVMGKKGPAAVYRKYINDMKKKTKEMQKEDAGVLSTRQQKERIKRLDKIKDKKADDAAERQKANDKEKQMTQKAIAKRRLAVKKEDTTTASIPNPATTAMGPSPFLDKRRKKDKSVMLTRFKKYIEDKGIVQKEAIVDPNDLRGRPKKADPNPESPYGIKHPLHPANLKKKKVKSEAPSPSVLKPTKPTDIIKHAKTLAKNPRDFMMNKKKYLDKARAKVFRMYPNG